MNSIKTGVTVAILGVLAACAQQEEPMTMVAPEPVFDKYGTGSCDEGYVYVAGAAQVPRCVPEDECIDSTQVGAASIPCPPPTRQRDDDDDNGRSSQPNPTTGAAN